MGLKALHEITIKSERRTISLKTPTGDDFKRGIAMQESATAGTAELADGTKPAAGLLTCDATQTGPQLADHVFEGRLELPTKSGQEASFEDWNEIEVEGADFLDAALIGSIPAAKTELTFAAGKWIAATTGKFVEGLMAEDLSANPNVAGNKRIRIQRVQPYPKQTANA
jgi:hypothetical protein